MTNILVADDEEPIRTLISRALTKLGYGVLQARDGEDAMKVWRQSTSPIDLVITDAVMPRCTGLELIDHLRQLEPTLPILLISGYPRDDAAPTLARHGVEFLAKPFRLDQLVGCIRGLLSPDVAEQLR